MNKLALTAFAVLTNVIAANGQTLTVEEARAIAKDAYIYGFPIVDNYRIQYSYFVDRNDREFKGAWNQVHNTARVYMPQVSTGPVAMSPA